MNIQTNNWRIDRRHALRALGSFIALPMMDCMVQAKGKAPAPIANELIDELIAAL